MAMSRSLGGQARSSARSPMRSSPPVMSSSPATMRRAVRLAAAGRARPAPGTRRRWMSRSRSWTAWNPFSYCLLTLSSTTSAIGAAPRRDRLVRRAARAGRRARRRAGSRSRRDRVAGDRRRRTAVRCRADQAECAGGRRRSGRCPARRGEDQQPLVRALAQEHERVVLGVEPSAARRGAARGWRGAARPARGSAPGAGPVPARAGPTGSAGGCRRSPTPSMPISSPAKTIGVAGPW